MPAPQTVDEVLNLLRKSNLLEPAKLDAFLTTQPGPYATPRALCDKLRSSGLLTPFQSDQLMKGKHKGFYLGKYKILDRIGLGGMGQVFLAEHTSMRRRAALKVMPPDRAENQYSRERFLREARAAGQLDHPNLVRAFDVDTENDVIFLVMEFVDGVSLQDLVSRQGPITPDRAGNYLYQAARGLEYLHARSLIHRDIKPANLLVDRQGVVKILDLGLVRSEQEDDNLTRGEGVKMLGTADYLSPEQAIDCSRVDVRTDIYSLGATAYFLLTGKPPFDADKVTQKLLSHQLKPVTPVHNLNKAVPVELSNIITKMLAKQLIDRYQTPTDLANALAVWGAKTVPLPTEQEIPAILGGSVGCSSTISLSDPKTNSRVGGSSMSLSNGGASSGSGIKYHFDSKPVLTHRGTDSAKGLQAPAITPIPKPVQTPMPKSKLVESQPPPPKPTIIEPPKEAAAPPSLPASMTHGDNKVKNSTVRKGIDLDFLIPPVVAAMSPKPPAPEVAASNSTNKMLVLLACCLTLVIGVLSFLMISGMVVAKQ
jgi:eukaryotic-like serine/threonine-protein kinase